MRKLKPRDYGVNFNSVETIPNLNASAAFKVDSSKVFKEDVDIVPVIIDKSLSYVPWGGDNAMPYDILKLIEGDEPLVSTKFAACVTASAVVCEQQTVVIPLPPVRCSMQRSATAAVIDEGA
ncbi:MAG: hypothetical protein IKZ92_04950 [Muribaculaceae bacterium]|nr:hypothetical protein [Muribaculaceae bacterium]